MTGTALLASGDDTDLAFEWSENKDTVIKNISVEVQEDDSDIAVLITNNNPFVVPDLDLQVVFYKDGKPVNVCSPQDIYDNAPGKTVIAEENTFGVSFDDYKVFLNQAHTF